MSIRVDMSRLPEEIVDRGPGFLLTSILDSRPHAAHLRFEVAGADGKVELRAQVGRTSHANCKGRPSVTVLWPAVVEAPTNGDAEAVADTSAESEPDVDRYSLIVDGEARPDGPDHIVVTVTGAVFHRPAPT